MDFLPLCLRNETKGSVTNVGVLQIYNMLATMSLWQIIFGVHFGRCKSRQPHAAVTRACMWSAGTCRASDVPILVLPELFTILTSAPAKTRASRRTESGAWGLLAASSSRKSAPFKRLLQQEREG